MGLLDLFRYGFSPDTADFLYRQVPTYLLLVGGLFILLYLILSLGGLNPQGPLSIAVLIVSLSAAFLLMTRSFGYWFASNVGAVVALSQGISIAIIIVFIGLVAYLILAK